MPAPGLVPYDLNAPFWSDGAEKARYLAIPDGATIELAEDGDLVFPVGTVLAKVFRTSGGALLETRLFMRHDDGSWAGYTYVWNEAGTDATLATGEHEIPAHGWTAPSRAQCMQCHTEAAGFALGPEVAQLNRAFTYPGGREANQLATLAYVGLLGSELPAAPAALPALADPAGPGAGAEAAGRAYLHANCAGCHRPGHSILSTMDLRFHVPLADMGICDAAPTMARFPEDVRLLVPGGPSRSLVYLRPTDLGPDRMPPLASDVVDEAGTGALGAFIESIAGCP